MIVAFTIPALGHVKPMLPIFRGLTEKGKRLVCFGHEKFASLISASGAEFRAYPPVSYDVDAPDFNFLKMAALLIEVSRAFERSLLDQVIGLKPQLILNDSMASWAGLISAKVGVPRIHTIPTLVFNSQTQRRMCREDGLPLTLKNICEGLPTLLRANWKSSLRPTAGEAFGLENSWRNFDPPLCELVFSLPEFQPGAIDGPLPRFYVGPQYLPFEEGFELPVKNYVLTTFGTLSNHRSEMFELAMRATVKAGFSSVVICGKKVDGDKLKAEGVQLERAHPGQKVLIMEEVPEIEPWIRGASAVIHHAGMASTWEGIRFSKMAVMMPINSDQKVLASMVAREGFGFRVRAREKEIAEAVLSAARERSEGEKKRWLALWEKQKNAGATEKSVSVILSALEKREQKI